MKPNSITITYLSKVSFASLNGADKEVDNINPIKKITFPNGETMPYVSAQAIRRALRDRLEDFGWQLSPVVKPDNDKGASGASGMPDKYIDDDLFGYMTAKKGKGSTIVRTSPIRVESLLALTSYKGDLDFGTNYMGKDIGANPNIFETEIHSGIYRGTILIELDRIGCGKNEGFETDLPNEERKKRVLSLIDAIRNLWSSGRQTRFLSDISPKFIAAAYMSAKNPIFLETVNVNENNTVDVDILQSVVNDYDKFISDYVIAGQEAVFEKKGNTKSLKEGFEKIESWVKDYYKD